MIPRVHLNLKLGLIPLVGLDVKSLLNLIPHLRLAPFVYRVDDQSPTSIRSPVIPTLSLIPHLDLVLSKLLNLSAHIDTPQIDPISLKQSDPPRPSRRHKSYLSLM